jgi:glycogen synthase
VRILVVSNLYPPDIIGGYEVACAQMVAELKHRGHEVRVLTATPWSDLPADSTVKRLLRLDGMSDDEIMPSDRRGVSVRAMLVDSHNVELLHQQMVEFEPEVVDVWNLTGVGGLALLLALELSGLPWVLHLGDALPLHLTGMAGPSRRRFAKLLMERLSGSWIVCSQGLLDEIAAGGAAPVGRVTLAPGWISGARVETRAEWFAGGRVLHCVYAGRLAEEKGVDIALDALGQLKREGLAAEIEFDIIGAGPVAHQLEYQAGKLGLTGQVRFRGQLAHADVLESLREADVLLFPTAIREPFGIVPLEAAGYGCVPIVTAGCGITEWLVDGVELIAVPRTATAFAEALRDIVGGNVDLGAIGRRGQSVVWRDFGIGGVATHVEAELALAIDSPRRPAVPWEDIGRMARIGEVLADRLVHQG